MRETGEMRTNVDDWRQEMRRDVMRKAIVAFVVSFLALGGGYTFGFTHGKQSVNVPDCTADEYLFPTDERRTVEYLACVPFEQRPFERRP